jgi:hypothetical protein
MRKITKHKIDLPVEYRNQCIQDILKCFDDGDWAQDHPKYQTWPVLFKRTEKHWEYIKNTFFNVVGTREFDILRAWSYVSFPGKESFNKIYNKHNCSQFTALFYLKISSPKSGTIFVDEETLISPIVDDSAWYIFDSDIEHAPSPWNHVCEKEPRVVLAVDYVLKEKS